ncbi:MAG: TonB-dependent receptor [Flavobacteriales bacterium]|nr:MAG: TonB-dependent receptor [Flavobacteriales bacterium]
MKRIAGCVAGAILAFNLYAQTGTIEGIISQTDSITPLSNVSIYLEGTSYGASTNGSGKFIIKDVPEGNYNLVASNMGYATDKKTIDVKSGQAENVSFYMAEIVLDLPPVVVSSSSMTGGNSGIKDIPGSAHYISPKQIEKFSYTDINKTLRAVPGINLQEEDGFGLRPNIGLRGTGVERSSKITVMEDGVLMAPAPYAAPSAYYFPTIGRMQAVEILKGSSQIKYGPYTTGGAINLISTQIPGDFSGRIQLLAGSYGSRNMHAYVGNSHKNVAYLVETFQYKADGFKELDNGGNTGFDKKDYLAKVRVNTKADAKIYQSLTFKLGHSVETSNETYLGLTEDDFAANSNRRYSASQKDQMNTGQNQYSMRHVLQLNKHFDLTTTVYRSDFHRNWYKLDKVKDSTGTKTKISKLLENPTNYGDAYGILTGKSSTNDDALHVKANNRSYYAQGVQTIAGLHFITKAIKHDVELGARLHEDQIDRFQWVDEYKMADGVMMLTKAGTPGTESNRIETANAFSGYLQYKINYDKLTVVPGIRYENIFIEREDYGKNDPDRTGVDLSSRSNQVDVWIPGIGLDYKLGKHLSAFAGVHKGFSPPGSKEETLPEGSVNYEAGIRYSKKALSGQAVIFYNDYDNLLGSDLAAAGGSGTTDLFNGGEVEVKGLEFQLMYDLISTTDLPFSVPASVVYTYTDAHFLNTFESNFDGWGDVESGDELPYLANNQLTFLIGIENRQFAVNFSGRYTDEMRTEAGQGEIADNEKTDMQLTFDASASYSMHKNIALFGNVTNITNQTYIVARRPAGLRPGMPRTFNVGIKANF